MANVIGRWGLFGGGGGKPGGNMSAGMPTIFEEGGGESFMGEVALLLPCEGSAVGEWSPASVGLSSFSASSSSN